MINSQAGVETPFPIGPSGCDNSRTASLRVPLPLVDTFGRVHRSLRISVTDRCNIRCQYCMPEVAQFLDSERLLSFDEIEQVVSVLAQLGVRKVRLTGGEPLMRPHLHRLIERLVSIAGIEDVALTTNGTLLADQVQDLVDAGLKRINISLDTLNEETFQRLARRPGLKRVMAGIDAAVAFPALKVRLNALVMRDINLGEVLELVAFARMRGLTLRFIEFMPLDAQRAWSRQQLVSGTEMRQLIESRFGPLIACEQGDASQPANDYRFAIPTSETQPELASQSRMGFIDSVTQPFCAACDRLRLTADGKLRNCLFGQDEWDARSVLRLPGASHGERREQIETLVRACLHAKRAAHGIGSKEFSPPVRAMYQIGG